jgi:hypothetical protein
MRRGKFILEFANGTALEIEGAGDIGLMLLRARMYERERGAKFGKCTKVTRMRLHKDERIEQ